MTYPIFIDVKVPAPDMMTSPYVVFYENGDWNIEFGGDVEFIESNVLTSGSCVSIFQMFAEEEFDCDSEGVDIYLEIESETSLDEPVVLIWSDGKATAGDRYQADKLVKNANPDFYSYIPLNELIDDLNKFILRHGDMMFDETYGGDDVQPLNFDED